MVYNWCYRLHVYVIAMVFTACDARPGRIKNPAQTQARVQEFVRGGGGQNLKAFFLLSIFQGGGGEIGEKIIFATKKVAKYR